MCYTGTIFSLFFICIRGPEPGGHLPGGGLYVAERGGGGRDQELRAAAQAQQDEEGTTAQGRQRGLIQTYVLLGRKFIISGFFMFI